ncbi:polysaccharide deacetylase family protein [Kitasatospora sp. NPDC004615]|uniref:polysaccharide deacetylase family protein n=1 Tax=Kitasatospora sp. NPDC004615 TaxID=3364017 RepID=UPI00368E80E5
MLRPPYGSRTPDVLRRLAESEATVVLWDVEPSDRARPGADAITRAVLDRTRPSSLIPMPDAHGSGDRSQTADALPGVIRACLPADTPLPGWTARPDPGLSRRGGAVFRTPRTGAGTGETAVPRDAR